ncbi:MAG TPA: hypothetical protein VE954_15850, partial [Oligoflexus sp.]|uniref:hypothetical protein n=1 Tax=Oligoflexus sp. TaxID=1971216 RepID=UPI002D60CFD8
AYAGQHNRFGEMFAFETDGHIRSVDKVISKYGLSWSLILHFFCNRSFSSYYQLEAAHGFLCWAKSRPQDGIESHLCHDFMREFCNLTAGAFKIWVERHAGSLLSDKDIRVKLPMHSPIMEDEICALPSFQAATQVRDAWRLELPSGTGINCMVEIIIWSWPAVASLQLEEKTLELLSSAGDELDDGSVEFL